MPLKSAAIVGAGIAGLVTALSLARRGIASDVFEQAPQLGEMGAGLQLSPNATRILGRLGVLDEITKHWRRADHIRLSSGVTMKPLAALPVGRFAETRWGSPYGVLHRSTLQQALVSAVLREPLCRLHLGHRIEDADLIALAEIAGRRHQLLIGADGVWSRVRSRITGAPAIRFSGNVAWRFTVAGTDAPGFLDPTDVTAYLGPGSHLVTYPLKEIGGFNIVAIAAGMNPGETWMASGSEAQKSALLHQFAGWHADIRELLSDAGAMTYWPLFEAGDGHWHNGVDTVLVGDAAHAMMPFAAQGAAMAIEDGFELAAQLSTLPVPQALTAWEVSRKARATRVRKRGAFNKFAYHARGPFRIGRDIVLSLKSPESLARDLDWLYGHDAGG